MSRLTWKRAFVGVTVRALGALLMGVAPSFAQQTSPRRDIENQTQEVDRDGWKIKEPTQAKECALRLAGLRRDLAGSATLATVEKDQTPFLGDKLNGRRVWIITVPDWSLQFKSAPGAKDSYRRTLDILLDPMTEQILKIRTHWPKDVPGDRVEPDARSTEEQISPEKYHGFASEAPAMSFVDALEGAPYWAGMALKAKQIQGLWVLWSSMDSEPRAMWVIELWGVPPLPAFHGEEADYPPNAEEYVRIVFDPSTRTWVLATHILRSVPLDATKPAVEHARDVP